MYTDTNGERKIHANISMQTDRQTDGRPQLLESRRGSKVVMSMRFELMSNLSASPQREVTCKRIRHRHKLKKNGFSLD